MTPSKAGRAAVIELGSDAVRLLIGQPERHRKTTALETERPLRRFVRHLDTRVRPLREDPAQPVLSAEFAAVETLAAVTRYLKLADRAGVPPILVARPDLVESPESPAILSLLASELTDPVRRLSTVRATELAFDAVEASLDDEAVELVVSVSATETAAILSAGRKMTYVCALPIGPTMLGARLPDPPTPLEWALEAVRLGAQLPALPAAVPLHAYAFGDGADVMAGFDTVRAAKRPYTLSIADLDRLSDEVLRSSARKVARRTGDDPWRVSQIAPSALILAAVLQRYGLQRCVALPQGLRDGIVLAVESDPEGWWLDRTAPRMRPEPPAVATDAETDPASPRSR